jgi:hypothetical protein
MLSAPAPAQGESGAYERQVRAGNHGIRELRVLPGNVRYMDYTDFEFIGEESEAALANAMRFLAGGEGIIIDLRRNRGGHHPSVRYLISHFLDAGRPLATFMRNGQVEGRSETVAELPAGRLVGKPLYVLTGNGTGSAAEEFVGHVAGYRLGDIVGESTGGAAYRNELVPMAGGLVFSVSTGRTVLAATGGDWEGVGIAPTIRAPVRNALYVAHAAALRRRAAQADGPERARLEGMADAIMARAERRTPALPLSAYVGRYGDWTVSEEQGRLAIRRGNLEPLALVPLGGNRFTYEDQPSGLMTFFVSGTAVSALELGLVAGPLMGRFERTQ